ncbi:MAG TPA: glycosyltransferase family 1 protein [Nitrospira sp.]|nr:glycosyltransferase family 1 protein [Nitrospira sp.]
MAHVLINAVSAKSGGAATYLINLAAQLVFANPEHRFTIYVPQALATRMPSRAGWISVIGTAIGSAAWWQRLLWDQIVLRNIIKCEGVDVLVSSSDFGVLSAPCRQVLLVRNNLFFSAAYESQVLVHHEWLTRMLFKFRRAMVLASMRSSDAIMVASHAMRSDMQRMKGCPGKHIMVNAFGVPLDRFACSALAASPPHGRFRLLYVSEYADYKNFTTLYRAVQHLSQSEQRDIRLVTTADPWQHPSVASVSRDEDQRLSRDPSVAPFVTNVGYVPYADVPALYHHCDALVFPSIAESFGHPLVEAMASGRPVIAADTPVNREICGEAAMYFKPLDAKALAETVLLLQNDPPLRAQMSMAGRQRVEQSFDCRDHVERLLTCIDEVVRGT